MFRITSAKATVCTLALGITACSMAPLVSQYATEYNKAFEDERNRALFLNVIRAKERSPMAHSHIVGIAAQATFGGSLNVAIPQGPGANSLNRTFSPGITLGTGASNYDVHPLFTKKFMQGFLRPVTLENLDYYWQQGWPRDFLLHLFVKKIEIASVQVTYDEKKGMKSNLKVSTDGNGNAVELKRDKAKFLKLIADKPSCRIKQGTEELDSYFSDGQRSHISLLNSPSANSWGRYSAFQCVLSMILPKMWIGSTASKSFVGVPVHWLQLRSQELEQVLKVKDGSYKFEPIEESTCMTWTAKSKKKNKKKDCVIYQFYRLAKAHSGHEICLGGSRHKSSAFGCASEDAVQRNEQGSLTGAYKILGGSEECSGKGESKACTANAAQFIFHLRSVEGMLYYLGQVMRTREAAKEFSVRVDWSRGRKGVELFTGQSGIAARPHIQVNYDGVNYHVPRGDSSRSMSALSIVTQLLALNLDAESPPASTTVNFVGARAIVR